MFEGSSLNGDNVMTVGKNDKDDVDHNNMLTSAKKMMMYFSKEVAHSYTIFLFIWIGK